jgi:hypothetical protein
LESVLGESPRGFESPILRSISENPTDQSIQVESDSLESPDPESDAIEWVCHPN